MFVVPAKRMRIKSRGCNRAAHSYTHINTHTHTHTHTHRGMSVSRHTALAAGKLHHISPEIFWRHIIVSL